MEIFFKTSILVCGLKTISIIVDEIKLNACIGNLNKLYCKSNFTFFHNRLKPIIISP